MNIEKLEHKNEVLAIIVRSEFHEDGIKFITPDNSIIQMGYMSHEKGKKIQAHIHKPYKRETYGTQEVLFIKKGSVKADFFNKEKEFVFSKILNENDWLVLLSGGHSFEVLEDVQMVEVKNGPYAGNEDKERF